MNRQLTDNTIKTCPKCGQQLRFPKDVDKVSDAFAERMKTIFRIAIRRSELYRNGNFVGKNS